MALLPFRLFGVLLLTLAVLIPSCQAVFAGDAATTPSIGPGVVQD